MKRKKKYIGIIVLLLLVISVTVGYSYLSANLSINGTSTIKTVTWDVHFSTIQVTTGSVTATEAPTISADGLSISYSVPLNVPGDYYEFTVNVVNAGTVDAKLNELPTLDGVSAAQDVYTNYTFTHADGTAITTLANESIAAGTYKTYKVRVEFDSNIDTDDLPETVQNLDLTVEMNYLQD